MGFFRRLYSSALINAFGSWLTFLAIALITEERYGARYVALVFLVQTLPAIIFSRSLAKLVPIARQEQAYWIAQVLLAVNSLVLVFFQSFPVIIAHLLIASVLKSLSNPLFNSLIGKWTPAEKQREVFTRVGGLQAGTLALAPVFGAWLKIATSASVLFALDGFSFLVALVLLKELFVSRPSAEQSSKFYWREIWAGISPRPRGLSPAIWQALVCWFLFLVSGALLNAIEFAGFSLKGMGESQIGYALSAWGAGSLISFFVPNMLGLTTGCIGYLASLALFIFSGEPVMAIAAFLFAGAASSYFAGSLRSWVQQSVPANENAAFVWAYANQVTQFINLVAYGAAGILLDKLGFYVFGSVMLLSVLILVFAIQGLTCLPFESVT